PALLDQVADLPPGDPLLYAPGEDRGGVRGHRLVGGVESEVAVLELALDARRVGGHPLEPVDRLDDHTASNGRPFLEAARRSRSPPSRGTATSNPSAPWPRSASALRPDSTSQ